MRRFKEDTACCHPLGMSLLLSAKSNTVKIRGAEILNDCCERHADVRTALIKWIQFVSRASWKNHSELKRDFPSADYVGGDRYVFNIRGNRYRLICVAVFFAGRLDIRFIGTHAEYNKINAQTI